MARKKGTKQVNHANYTNTGRPATHQPVSSGGKTTAKVKQPLALNPPFDNRMRRIGSPLNQTGRMKRGWIQNSIGTERVNFLFNPAAIDISSALDVEHTQSPLQKSEADVTNVSYPSTGSGTGVSLLYDRTYELFSSPRNAANVTSAATFGAWADVMAWYKFVNMYQELPTTWTDITFTQPLNYIPSYLFIGPYLYVYGVVSSLSTTITHWTQEMIPQRAKVDVGFNALPLPTGQTLDLLHGAGLENSAIDPGAAVGSWVDGIFDDGSFF